MALAPTRLSWATSIALGLICVACSRPSSENIQLWKTTQKGPERLHEALADHGTEPRLRAEAAVALVDIGRADEVDAVLMQASADDRAEIAKTLIPAYEVAMKDPSPERALAYRDALYSLRQSLPPDDQKRIDAELLPVLEASLKGGKLRQGRHSLDKMLTAMGPDAGAMLAKLCAEPDVPLHQTTELLAKVGDEAARERCAAALVAHAPPAPGKDRDKDKAPRADVFLKALGTLGGPSAVKFLEAKATGADKDEALLATRALGERRDPAVLAFALKVAADPKADRALRDEMFGVVEGIGGLEAETGLVGIISSDKDEIVRYRAFESVLAARKADGIQPGLEAFPASASYKKVDVDDLLVKLIEKLGESARPALVRTLGSHVALARMTAAMALEQIGRAPDAPALDKLAGDTAPIKGFPTGETVGKQATHAANAVRKRS
jgi:HEAT repeat protein